MPPKLKIHKPSSTLRKKVMKDKKRHTQTNSRSSCSKTSTSTADTPYGILDFMPLKSRLVLDIIILAASLEAHAEKHPEEDIYNIIKTNKTFKLFSKSLQRGFGQINERAFSYLFLAIILHTSNDMDFTFEGFSFIEHPVELTKYLKGMSSVVLEELMTGIDTDYGRDNHSILKQNTSVKSKSSKRLHHSRNRIRVGGRKTYRNVTYKQTGGEFDFALLFAFLMYLYARFGPVNNPRFYRISLPIMTLYFFYSIFSLYNNVRYLLRPNGISQEDMAPDFTATIKSTSDLLTTGRGVVKPADSSVFEPLNQAIRGLPSATQTFLSTTTDNLSVGTIATLVFGWFGYREAVAGNTIAPMLQGALTDFMTTPYYNAILINIRNAAQHIAERSTAAIASTRTRPMSSSRSSGIFVGAMETMRSGIHSLTGVDLVDLDNKFGDYLYNGLYASEISKEILQTVMQNTQTAIKRLGEDFTRILQYEITHFRTRLVRHGMASGIAVAGIVFSSLFFYRYYRYRRMLRRPGVFVPPPSDNGGPVQLLLLKDRADRAESPPPYRPHLTPEAIAELQLSESKAAAAAAAAATAAERRRVALSMGIDLDAPRGRIEVPEGYARGGDYDAPPISRKMANTEMNMARLNLDKDPVPSVDDSEIASLIEKTANMGVSEKPPSDRCESPK